MTEQASLGEVLEASRTAPLVPTEEATGEVETPQAAPPAAEIPPKEDKPKEEPWHVKAVADERRKRQDAEKRLAELEAKQTPPAKPNLFEDPDQWEKQLDERVEKKVARVQQESEQRYLALCEQGARARHTDFEDMANVFAEYAKSTPGLIDEARKAPDPAEFIYTAGVNLKRFKEAGSIDALLEQAREEGRQEALQGKVRPKVPESLTDIAGGKGEAAKTWSGPKPLGSLLPKY